jgi:hypothetical protein
MGDKEIKFTYLFGAGASAKVIPVVEGLPESFVSLKSFLKQVSYKILEDDKHKIQNKSAIDIYDAFIKDIDELIGELRNAASFDTLAKKYYLINNIPKVNKMKCLLAIMFIHNYYIDKKRTDSRYELFIASLLEKEGNIVRFPQNVNIISWNYDFQFEMALSQFTDKGTLSEINRFINSLSSYEKDPNLPHFIKLNGSALSFTNNKNEVIEKNLLNINNLSRLELNNTVNIQLIRELLKIYLRLSSEDENYNETISFAWENNYQFIVDVRNKALEVSHKTNYLVVVGYSFPTFNRTLDHAFLNGLDNINKLFIYSMGCNISKNNGFLSRRPPAHCVCPCSVCGRRHGCPDTNGYEAGCG